MPDFTPQVQPSEAVSGLFVREWTGAELMEWDDALSECRLPNGGVSTGTLRTTLLVLSLCDADGKRLYADRKPATLAKCAGRFSRPEIESLFTQASQLNGVLTSVDQVDIAEGN